MTEKERQSMIEDAMVVISGDMFQCIYNLDNCSMWNYVTNLIKKWAREFVDELNWNTEYDERDWLWELEDFEEKKFNDLKKIYS